MNNLHAGLVPSERRGGFESLRLRSSQAAILNIALKPASEAALFLGIVRVIVLGEAVPWRNDPK